MSEMLEMDAARIADGEGEDSGGKLVLVTKKIQISPRCAFKTQ